MIIFFGDLHCQEKEPHRTACLDFLDYLYKNFNHCTILCGGDLFHQSSHNHRLVDSVIERISKFNDFRIISGNHDQSRRLSNILLPFRHYDGITIYSERTEFEIEDIKFIALPSKPGYEKEYENIEGTWDYSLCHFEPIQKSFNSTGIELKFKVNTAHIFAHIHEYDEYIDNFGNKVLISGSVVSTRYGEQDWEKNLYEITKEGFKKQSIPQMFTYQTLNYGEFPENKNNILNVINAPSVPAVWEKYKDYFIRRDGIQVLRTENESELKDVVFESGNIIDKFNRYATEKSIPLEIVSCANQYLQEVV